MDLLNSIYVFLIEWDIPIYFIAAIGLIVAAVQFVRSRSLSRRAMFTLEREEAQTLRSNALILFVVFGLALGIVLYVNLQVAPTLPAELLDPPTPTPNIFATPLSSPTPLQSDAETEGRPRVTPDLVPTVTLPAGLQVPAPQPTVPLIDTPAPPESNQAVAPPLGSIPEGGGCTPAINIQQPTDGTAIFGTVEFFGSATAADFGFYLLEIRGEATGNEWVNILGTDIVSAVENGPLGSANLDTLPNGSYEARLVVLDAAGQAVGQCQISVVLDNQ